MRRWIAFLGLCVLLSACASQPQVESQAEFNTYWNCAYSAAAHNFGETRLSAREVAVRAQAHCYDSYLRYQTAHERYSRSVVTPSGYEFATAVADHSAIQRKRDVTKRLTQLVAQARE